jgi:hypothetical protein
MKMGAFCFIPLLKAIGISGIGLISRRRFDVVYLSIPLMVDEADGSRPLHCIMWFYLYAWCH